MLTKALLWVLMTDALVLVTLVLLHLALLLSWVGSLLTNMLVSLTEYSMYNCTSEALVEFTPSASWCPVTASNVTMTFAFSVTK